MFQFNVSQLLKAPLGTVREYELDDDVDIGDEAAYVHGGVTLLRTNRGILVTGRLETGIAQTCSRCLNEYKQPLSLDIEEEYFPTVDILSGARVALPLDEPGAFSIDKSNVLDLGEAIRQYALLAVPMKPLCRPDCAGLCPTCGANLNKTICSCLRVVDPRWQKLRDLAHS